MVNRTRKTNQKRRRFTRDFKIDAIKLVKEGGMTPKEVNEHLGLGPQLVQRWMKEYKADSQEAFPGVGQPKSSEKELYALKRKLKRVEEERDILKKALAIFSTKSA